MRIGVIGLGLMGSSLARCLADKVDALVLYNRTREKAERIAAELGAETASSPRDLVSKSDAVILFVSDDEAVLDVVLGDQGVVSGSLEGKRIVNMATITPMTSLRVMRLVEARGGAYIENPVYGSVDAAAGCRLFSIIGCHTDLRAEAEKIAGLYSSGTIYAGEPPAASVLKLALNNIGLALPALLAESLSLLKAWGLSPELLKKASSHLWFGSAVERYWGRIMSPKPPRFRVEMAGKDYVYMARSLAHRGRPAPLSSTIASMYLEASRRYKGGDYPLVARYYMGDE